MTADGIPKVLFSMRWNLVYSSAREKKLLMVNTIITIVSEKRDIFVDFE